MNLASIFSALFGGVNNGALGIMTPRSMFGGMATNPSINSLTNANAMARKAMMDQAQSSTQDARMGGVGAKPTYGQAMVQGDPDMFGNFDPISQQGAFGRIASAFNKTNN